MALNVQNVLAEESNFWRVADPAMGAGYIETYTQGPCNTAWKVFQAAEAGDWPAPNPSSTADLPVIGTTAYPLKQEFAPETEALS